MDIIKPTLIQNYFKSVIEFTLVIGIAFSLMACDQLNGASNKPAKSNLGVAVIGISDLLQRLGEEKVMEGKLTQYEAELQKELKKSDDSVKQYIEQRYKEFGDTLTPEQQQIMALLRDTGDRKIESAKSKVRQNLAQYQLKLALEFRDSIKPIAAQIAKDKGFGAVILKSNRILLTYSESVDITDDVVIAVINNKKKN